MRPVWRIGALLAAGLLVGLGVSFVASQGS
jgi:hypothetical protein